MSGTRHPPTAPDGAEIIIRHQFTMQGFDDGAVPIPEILIVANKDGFRWLSRYFAWLAELSVTEFQLKVGDSDNHQHLTTDQPPINPELSAQLEMRLGILTPEGRETTLKKYGLTPQNRQQGSLFDQFGRILDLARAGKGVGGGQMCVSRARRVPRHVIGRACQGSPR